MRNDAPTDGRAFEGGSGLCRGLRGGAYTNGGAWTMRADSRGRGDHRYGYSYIGFRIAK